MPEPINYNGLSEVDFHKKMNAIVQRHLSNVENSLTMMRGGQFIDAYHRLGGTREGLDNLKNLLESRAAYVAARVNTDEKA
jgi:hypothetical protein